MAGHGPGMGPGAGMMGQPGMAGHRGMMAPGDFGPRPSDPGQRAGAPVDMTAHFMQEMIPHHQDALVMADLALAQAEHPELDELAISIKDVQAREIDQMRAWYQAWYGGEVPASLMAQMPMMTNRDPAAIDGAQPFDKAFIEAMIPHHAMAVMMASHALQQVQQPELRAMLESIVASQGAEIQQMRQWYSDWYGAEVPGYGPGPHWGRSPA
jgi:uncharacterized protein (DUF305 family)